MKWEKIGQIFEVEPIGNKLKSHAANPLPIHLNDDVFRIFYNGRDESNRSSVGYVDIDILSQEIKKVCSKPVLVHGDKNSFYCDGISIGNHYKSLNNENLVLFMAWQTPKNGHWRGDVGRIKISEDYSSLSVYPDKPFMGVDAEDEVSLSYPFVIYDQGIFKMWYGSTITWKAENGEMIHVIKYATSQDGESWEKHGIAIPYELNEAQAFSHPSIIINENGYHMWYSYRSGKGEKYRIGYAHSVDGVVWKRDHDKVGIDVSESGWDSEMICYPSVFKHQNNLYIMYNGNEHGKQGFGLAILKDF